jgi:hypothetical protein
MLYPVSHTERDLFFYPTGIVVIVSLKIPKNVSIVVFWDLDSTNRAPVD